MVTLQKHLKARATAEELFVIIARLSMAENDCSPPQVTVLPAAWERNVDIHK